MSNRPAIVEKCPNCNAFLRQRSLEQNSKLHSLLADIAEQKDWAGRKWDVEQWKRILVGGFCRSQGESVEIVPAIDGHGVEVLYRHTSRMSKQEMAELITYIEAWAIDQGIQLHTPEAA